MEENSQPHKNKDPYAIALGQRLIQIRAGYTQEQQAEYLQLHVNTLARYERGERLPHFAALKRLAECGVNLDWLLTGRGAPLYYRGVIGQRERLLVSL